MILYFVIFLGSNTQAKCLALHSKVKLTHRWYRRRSGIAPRKYPFRVQWGTKTHQTKGVIGKKERLRKSASFFVATCLLLPPDSCSIHRSGRQLFVLGNGVQRCVISLCATGNQAIQEQLPFLLFPSRNIFVFRHAFALECMINFSLFSPWTRKLPASKLLKRASYLQDPPIAIWENLRVPREDGKFWRETLSEVHTIPYGGITWLALFINTSPQTPSPVRPSTTPHW